MDFVTRTPACASFALKQAQALKSVPVSKISNVRSVSLPLGGRSFPYLKAHRSQLFCAAKKETVDKVCQIVRKQLALPDDAVVIGESNIPHLEANSLDTVEIVMALEEEFGIFIGEDSAQSIMTVQGAAEVIEEPLTKNGA